MSDALGDRVLAGLSHVMGAVTEAPNYRPLNLLSMSALGGCRRQGAYYLARTDERQPEPETRAADVGTALHAVWLPLLADMLGGRYEVEAWLHAEVPGTVDLLLPDAVVDLKTLGRASFDFLREPRRTWLMQVTAGALATDRPLCGVLAVCRDTGRAKWFGWEAAEHAAELEGWLADAGRPPEEVPRDYRGPGIDRQCDWCPFAWTCWPEVPGRARQAVLVHDDAGTEAMLEQYMAAAAAEAQAVSARKFARACLSGSEAGRYGALVLRWRRSAGRETLDAAEARRLLTELGLPIPIRTGEPSTAIDVRPAG